MVMKTIAEEGGGDDYARIDNNNKKNSHNNNNNNSSSNNNSPNTRINGSFKLNLNSDSVSPPPPPPPSSQPPQGSSQAGKLPNVTVVTLRDPNKVRANLLSTNRKR